MREESRQEARVIFKTLLTTAALRGVRPSEQDMKKFLRWVDEGFLTKRILKVLMHGYRARGKRARELARALEGRAYGTGGQFKDYKEGALDEILGIST